MKKIVTLAVALFVCLSVFSQSDSAYFKGHVRNEEYKIYIKMNLYDKDVLVPGQDILGNLDGYIGSQQSRQIWPIISSRIINEKTAEIEVVNDYGSEDFTARIVIGKDGTYTLKKTDGSTLKFPVKGKWQKIPSTIIFKK